MASGKASEVVDVDGSYLYKKHKDMNEKGENVVPLKPPMPPPLGWVTVTKENYSTIASSIPPVTAGIMF